VAGDLSYPSGHATYGYLMAYLLADMVPERRDQLIARAGVFASQRAVCGVHFPSDLEAGRKGAEWLAEQFRGSSDYRNAAAIAASDLRLALGLPAQRPAAPQ
jgi:acid phosphatase (class A)